MDRAAFLQKIDEQVAAKERETAATSQQRSSMRGLTADFIAQVKPLLEKYVADLRQRKIDAQLDEREQSLSFEIHFTRGGYYGFSILDGKITESWGGTTHSRGEEQDLPRQVDLAKFEERIQRTVEEFMRRAPGHGGFISPTM